MWSLVVSVASVASVARPDDPDQIGILTGAAARAAARSPETVMKLHMMPDKGLKGAGAVCIDGSDAGYYARAFAPRNNHGLVCDSLPLAGGSRRWVVVVRCPSGSRQRNFFRDVKLTCLIIHSKQN